MYETYNGISRALMIITGADTYCYSPSRTFVCAVWSAMIFPHIASSPKWKLNLCLKSYICIYWWSFITKIQNSKRGFFNLFILHMNCKSRKVPLWQASIIAWSVAPRGRGLIMVSLISSSSIRPSVSKSIGHSDSSYPSISSPSRSRTREPWPE